MTSAYGHFGRSEDAFSWEKTSKADEIREMAGI
jgi:S-adenosylmethionine synthetase